MIGFIIAAFIIVFIIDTFRRGWKEAFWIWGDNLFNVLATLFAILITPFILLGVIIYGIINKIREGNK